MLPLALPHAGHANNCDAVNTDIAAATKIIFKNLRDDFTGS
jgi:hypothetical protein